MSAGGISYDCLTTSRKVTLPSVESWGTNMNIIKDPNKGIYTRRKDKVGETQEVLLAQENSGDRIAECINVYARGVNPMVSVSYDNYGNNGGASSRSHFRKQGVKLPYKPEVFIPPVLRQEDLVPLSRLPRNWVYAFSNPSMPNLIQENSCSSSKNCIETRHPQFEVDTNKQYIKELPKDYSMKQPEVKEDFLKVYDIDVQKSQPYQGQFHDKVMINNSKINENKQLYDAFTNKCGDYKKYNRPSTDIQRNIHKNMLQQFIQTNKSQMKENRMDHDILNKNLRETPQPGQQWETNKIQMNEKSPFLSTKPMNGIEENILEIDEPIEVNKSDSTSLKYLPQIIDYNNSLQHIRNPLEVNIDVKTGSSYHTIDRNIFENNPFQSQKIHPYLNINTTKYNPQMERTGSIESYTTKNINENKMNYDWKTNKIIQQEKILLDPSNIQTKNSVCIPVDTSKSKNIYKQTTPIDISSIPMKDKIKVDGETSKTFIEQDKWIGTRPEREARVLKSNVNFGSNKSKDNVEFYDINGTNRNDIENRNIHVGSFDPKPQGITKTRDGIDMDGSSTIDYRYRDLKKNVQEQFNQRYM